MLPFPKNIREWEEGGTLCHTKQSAEEREKVKATQYYRRACHLQASKEGKKIV